MRLIAHRGFAGMYPENTLRAVEEAVAHADAIEVDVRRCASGELVVVHDETVDRVSDGHGRVAELPLAELRALDVLGTGEGVPTLATVLAAIPLGIGVNVELKEEGLAADAIALARETDLHVTLSSFSPAALADARETDPDVPRALLFDAGPREAIGRARELDCAYLHPRHDLCEEQLVNRAHRAGMSVNAWTVENRSAAERLAAVGVDGVIADRWGVLPENGG